MFSFLPKLSSEHSRKFFLIMAFFIFTPITLGASAFSLLAINAKQQPTQTPLSTNISTKVLSASDFDSFPSLSSTIVSADARSQILRNYLTNIDSELLPYTDLLVETADKYNMDYRLLTAIAIKESGACRVIPPGSHNCWGWGIHSKGTLTFDSYEEAIETVSKGLKEKYIDLGYVTPDQIMTKYAHKDSTTWGPDVAAYMEVLQ